MAERNYKVGEAIKIEYQAPNKETGLTIISEILLPGDVKDSNFPDVTLDEVLGKGVYTGTYIPDTQGEWATVTHKDDGDGQVIKRYSVGAHDVHSVGEGVGTAIAGVAVVDGKADNIQTKVNDIDTAVDGIDSQLDTVEGKIDTLDNKVGGLDTPPMIS